VPDDLPPDLPWQHHIEVALNDERGRLLATLEKVKRLLEEALVEAPDSPSTTFFTPSTTFLKKAKRLLAEVCAESERGPLRRDLERQINHRLEMRTGRPGDHTINDSGRLLEMAQMMEESRGIIKPWDAAWAVAGKDPRSITNVDTCRSIAKRLYRKLKRYGRVWPAIHLAIKGVTNESTRSEVERILKDYNSSTGSVPLTNAADFPDEYLQKLRLVVSGVDRDEQRGLGQKASNFSSFK
jgi:hypothetical protein